ncbi:MULTISPECIES: glucose PTS transporter transcription antiterminator GlcT [Metabacillus]|uniref:Transcription antiterminator n=1 Tax=Metabacillus hrfriensis TaxID=3048891 RepID=A0ACD4RG62_9BACI|nr:MULTISPECIES: transcription antiterminator [Metabacillus]UAL53960.1 transcription antiterminator [Metabacillus dongyingensis]UOK59350.1 transcription antiterminator [Bacillus sp. OVS6]USK30276.1 transcription antiterminator [Bacillus sp. CMF21]WHZ59525.1 transcription antiterminator [Metabacillus sp. CT-WN-B3]
MKESFTIKKVLNNNVLIAEHDSYEEVVLIGKGIGFGKKRGDMMQEDSYEKMFVLTNQKEQEQFKMLLPFVDEDMIEVVSDVIHFIAERVKLPLNEHIHIALIDHITFAIKRLQKGMDIKNPFLIETKTLYPNEFLVAEEVIHMINDRLKVNLPEGEIGFIALHIHSAITNKPIADVNQFSQLINQLVGVIEDSMKIKVNHDSVNYLRLVRHLRYTIERVLSGETVEEPEKFTLLLKKEYPLCYNTSWKMIKVMQQFLKKPVYEAEAVYLTLHLYRLTNKT